MGNCKTCGGYSGTVSSSAPSCACDEPDCDTFCEEDHLQEINNSSFGYTLRVTSAFVWPSKTQGVALLVECVERIALGTVLWNPKAGYLHVTSFDYDTQTVVAVNQGESCNLYTGGESVEECTDFVVGPPSCPPGPTPIPNIPYLAADFISPGDGDCALASVTNIIGLTIADTVSVDGYTYRIGDIIDSDTIQLCNDGDGAPVGTVIPWDDDGDELPNIPILVTASENPCLRDGISAGVILACDGSDTAKPLTGSLDSQIPVWNAITERFELKTVSAQFTSCTSLTADLTVDPVHVGSYIILVFDSSAFVAGNVVIISGIYYTVNVVDNPTTMHITPNATPGAIVTYPTGTAVCLDQSPSRCDVDTLQDTGGPTTFSAINDNESLGPLNFAIANTSPSRVMHVIATYTLDCANMSGTHADPVTITAKITEQQNADPPVDVLTEAQSSIITSDVRSCHMTWVTTFDIAPGDSFGLQISGEFRCFLITAGQSITLNLMKLRASFIAVAV